jgi:hypothetical protein
MSEFINEWRTQVVPLRRRAGFEIAGAWSNPETNRFVWVVGHEGDFELEDRSYYGSLERRQLSPDPARLIEEARSKFVSSAI